MTLAQAAGVTSPQSWGRSPRNAALIADKEAVFLAAVGVRNLDDQVKERLRLRRVR